MSDHRRGVWYGVTAYALWGLFPLYWPLLKPALPVEILAHRIAWSLLAVLAVLTVRWRWVWFGELIRQPRRLALLALAAVIISVNWLTYIYAVNSGHVVEGALGYFINPLVSVVLGVIVFRERLRPGQWVAVGLGTVAVTVLTVDYGRLPWIALVLACSFGTYGMVKKFAGVGAAEGLTIETLILFLPAVAYLVVQEVDGQATFTHSGWAQAALLAGAGVVTAVPMLFFSAAATRIPLTMIGLLQYIAPILQFLCGVLIFREAMATSRWTGFGLVWLALMIFTADGLRAARASAVRARTAQPLPASEPAKG